MHACGPGLSLYVPAAQPTHWPLLTDQPALQAHVATSTLLSAE